MIYIWVRAPVAWDDAELARAQVRPDFRPRLDLWNETFNIPYQRFRQRLAEIADLNHSKVEGAVRADWDQIPNGALVMPVDDDDWFAPDAARVLEAEPSARGYLWASRWIEVPISAGHRFYLIRRRLLPASPPKWICTTNNYALTKDAEAREILGNHVAASRWFEPRIGGDVKRVQRELSAANRTLASMTSLRIELSPRRFDRAQLLRKFRRYQRLYHEVDTGELDWARPYVTMMAELMDQLEPAEGA